MPWTIDAHMFYRNTEEWDIRSIQSYNVIDDYMKVCVIIYVIEVYHI